MPDHEHNEQAVGAQPAQEGHAQTTHAAAGHGEHHYKLGDIPSPPLLFANAVVLCLFLVTVGFLAARKLSAIPHKVWSLQNFGEFVVEAMQSFTRGIIGPGGERYVPLVGTIFFFIMFGNMWGLVPGLHAPTANMSTTLALGIIVFVFVQYTGIRNYGLGGYLKHFAGPMWFVSPLLMPIEIISELVKPFTLAMRLFGNIFGEDTVIIVLAALAVQALPQLPILPLQLPIMLLALLTSFVQALVFSLLTCIYISLMSHHEEGHEASHAPRPGAEAAEPAH